MGLNFNRMKPYRASYFRRRARLINDVLLSTEIPDRTALKKEADEFIEYIKKQRTAKDMPNSNIKEEFD